MPPDPTDALDETQLQRLADWIQMGAVGPQGVRPRPILQVPHLPVQHTKPAPITAFSLSPDGRFVAIAETGRVVLAELNALRSGETLGQLAQRQGLTLTDFPGKINSLRFSAAGTRLVVAAGIEGLAGEAHVIDVTPWLADAQPWGAARSLALAELSAPVFGGHRDSVYAATMSPDGKWLATGGYDRVIKLWDVAQQRLVADLTGHNGAVFDLEFTADNRALLSASADQTVKVWDVASASRIDTLGQPEGEVAAVRFLPESRETGSAQVLAISSDNRLRIWRWLPQGNPVPNPLRETRFVDETPLLAVAVEPGGQRVAIATQSGNLKLLSTQTWDVVAVLEPTDGTPTGLSFSPDRQSLWVTDLNGRIHHRTTASRAEVAATVDAQVVTPVYLADAELPLHRLDEGPRDSAPMIDVPRHVAVAGNVSRTDEVDLYRWSAKAGEVWAIDVDAVGSHAQISDVHPSLPASGDASELDPLVTILDSDGRPILRTRLQAIRESYFTFRGKDSMQSDDFRLFGQQEMGLDQYLYASGEVTRLWMHPRGPDSGFDVYPGGGQRWTYFGTSHVTHALGEPAYVVQPIVPGQTTVANGLPTFDIVYRNDDDPSRRAGKGSRLLFTAPVDGPFTAAVQDTRRHGGEKFQYQLRMRPAQPDFQASVTEVSQGLLVGAGREFTVSIERFDEFTGPVEFSIEGLPAGVLASLPIVVEAGQRSAQGTIWIQEDHAWPENVQPQVMASAEILGQRVTRSAGSLGPLKKGASAPVVPWIVAREASSANNVSTTGAPAVDFAPQPSAFQTLLRVPPGGTISAQVRVQRGPGVDGEISFGNAQAARNPTHGVYVDNIGLNGLLLLGQMNEREFFLTADPKAGAGKRPFFLKAEIDGGITTLPIWVEVIADTPADSTPADSTPADPKSNDPGAG
jgi:hypothetical protein